MTDLTATAKAFKRVTLDDIYTAIDEVKNRQEEDSRYFNQRIDTLSQRIDTSSALLNQRMDSLNQRIDNLNIQLNQKLDTQVAQINQKIDTQISQVRQEIGQLNQRFDTVMQMLVDIAKQVMKLAEPRPVPKP